jgi:hypothetical protein
MAEGCKSVIVILFYFRWLIEWVKVQEKWWIDKNLISLIPKNMV